MHLTDLSEFSEEEKGKIYKNEKINKSKNYIDVVLAGIKGGGYNKRPNPKVFLPKIRDAVKRAKGLDSKSEDYPKDLGSHVYKLIEKLIIPG